MKFLLLIILFSPLFGIGQAKSKIDSVVIEFLKTQPNTPTPVLKITGNQKKGSISRNYFWQPNESIIKDSIKLKTFLFGSGVSHSSSYLLIEIKNGMEEKYHIIETTTIEEGITELFRIVEPFHLTNSQKALLVNQLSVAYY